MLHLSMLSINSLSVASSFISFFRKKEKQSPLSSWIDWRETALDIYGSDNDTAVIDEAINSGKLKIRKLTAPGELQQFASGLSDHEKQEVYALLEFFRIVCDEREDYIPGTFNSALFGEVIDVLSLNELQKKAGSDQAQNWSSLKKDKKFRISISVPSSLKPILIDFFLRWYFLYLYRIGSMDTLGDWMGVGGTGFFLITQFMFIPFITILICIVRDKRVVKKTQVLLSKIDNRDIQLKIKNSAWDYLLVVVLILQAVLIVSFFDDLSDPFALGIIAVLFGSYLLVILNYFSKTVPVYKNIVEQLSQKKHRELQYDLDVDANDEEIVTLEVTMKSANEKMNAYVIEAALFGALAFGGFLTLISSSDFSVESLELFNKGMRYIFYDALYFENSAESATAISFVFSKPGLIVVMCYQSLFCSIFFLSVIASRLRFSVLSDQIDRSLQLAKSYNEKEEVLHAMNQENGESLKSFNEKIRKQLQLGYRTQDQLAPIVEYMKFFRTLGISAFFMIVVTGGMFVSLQLSIVLLFIAVLSLFYFRLSAVRAQLKSLKIEIQEFYFRINRYSNWISWVLIISAIFLKSFHVPGAGLVMLLGFVILFLHYVASLFIPVNINWSAGHEQKTFGGSNTLPKLLEHCFKIALAFFFLGFMFKSFHWPGAALFLIIGLMLMMFYFLFTKKTLVGPAWLGYVLGLAIFSGLYAYLAKINHWGGSTPMYVFAQIMLVISTILIFIYYKNVRPLIRRTVFIIGAVLVLFNFRYPRFILNTLSFNYAQFEKTAKYNDEFARFDALFFRPVEEGGLSNATSPGDIAKLEKALAEFEEFYKANDELGKDAEGMNGWAWNAFERSENLLIVEEALKWSEVSLSMDRNWMFLDTYANLLVKLNRYAEALPIAKEAFGKGADPSTEKLIQEIEKQLAQPGVQ